MRNFHDCPSKKEKKMQINSANNMRQNVVRLVQFSPALGGAMFFLLESFFWVRSSRMYYRGQGQRRSGEREKGEKKKKKRVGEIVVGVEEENKNRLCSKTCGGNKIVGGNPEESYIDLKNPIRANG